LGDLLYLTFDGFDLQYITALNKMTGKTVWQKDREVDFGNLDGDGKKAYSTPIVIQSGGRDMLISPFAMATIAYDPKSGKSLWKIKHGGMNAAGRPLFGNGLLYINSADGPNPLIAIPPDGEGDITDRIVWRTKRAVPKRPSEILVGDLLFMMDDGGIASCLDAKTGEEIWTQRIGGEYWSSPLYANGLIYCFSKSGVIPVFKATRKFEQVAENHLNDGFVASPAVAGDALILRSATHLYRIQEGNAR
jgi:outer membrane protein assembly factor BamB